MAETGRPKNFKTPEQIRNERENRIDDLLTSYIKKLATKSGKTLQINEGQRALLFQQLLLATDPDIPASLRLNLQIRLGKLYSAYQELFDQVFTFYKPS